MTVQTAQSKLLKQGNRRAVTALRKSLKCSDQKGLLHNTDERNRLKKQYMIDILSKTLVLANELVTENIVYVSNPLKAIADLLEQSAPYPIPISQSESSLTITLANHSYIFQETGFYWFQIVFLGTRHITLLSPQDDIDFLLEYDKFVISAEKIFEKECMNYMKHKKSSQLLTEAANVILKDILAAEQNVFFRIDAQKNGYFRCRVMELAEWMPGKTIRTDLEHLREDFIGALKDVRNRREFGIEQ